MLMKQKGNQALSAGMAETAETQSLSEQLSIAERSTKLQLPSKYEKQIKHASKAAAENKQLAKEEKQGSKLANDMAKKNKKLKNLVLK